MCGCDLPDMSALAPTYIHIRQITPAHVTYITCTTRSWKNHLRSVAKENQLSIYQTLCILVHEVDRTLFSTRMDQFTNYWNDKEPQFIKYFNTYYKERAGKN